MARAFSAPALDPLRPRAEVVAELRRVLGTVSPAPQLHRRETLSTGLLPLDRLLQGGLPRGRVVEVSGSGGCMSLALGMLSAATQRGQLGAFVDAVDGLDPRCAGAAGVVMSRLLWVRAGEVRRALQATDLLVETAGFGLVVVFVAEVATPPRLGHAFVRLQQRCERADVTVVVMSAQPLAGAAAALTLRCQPAEATWDAAPGGRAVLRGRAVHVEVARNRLGPAGDGAILSLMASGG